MLIPSSPTAKRSLVQGPSQGSARRQLKDSQTSPFPFPQSELGQEVLHEPPPAPAQDLQRTGQEQPSQPVVGCTHHTATPWK